MELGTLFVGCIIIVCRGSKYIVTSRINGYRKVMTQKKPQTIVSKLYGLPCSIFLELVQINNSNLGNPNVY